MRHVLAAVAALLVLAPAAEAAELRGKTSQGRDVRLQTDKRGRPVEGGIKWLARCQKVARYPEDTGFRRPFDLRSRTELRDEGNYTFLTKDGYRMRAHTWIRGRRTGPRRWEGRFGLSLVVRRNGRTVDRCKTGVISWRVSR